MACSGMLMHGVAQPIRTVRSMQRSLHNFWFHCAGVLAMRHIGYCIFLGVSHTGLLIVMKAVGFLHGL